MLSCNGNVTDGGGCLKPAAAAWETRIWFFWSVSVTPAPRGFQETTGASSGEPLALFERALPPTLRKVVRSARSLAT
eukprot:2005359-Prorocentrum_lima.AAC.1